MASYFWSSTSSTDPTLGANWTRSDGVTGTAPGNGDDVYIQALPGVALANIGAANMSSVTLNSLTLGQSFVGTIGTADTSASPFGYWRIGAMTWTLGAPAADGVAYSGSGRVKLNFGAAQFTGVVVSAGASADAGAEPVRILGAHAGNRLTVLGGRVGVATNLPGETSTLAEVDVTGGAAVCNLGPGVSWTNANVAPGGMLSLSSGSSGALSAAPGASAVAQGPTAIATVNAGGSVLLNQRPASGAAVATLNLYPTGVADFSQNPAAVSVTTLNHQRGGVISANPANPSHLTVGARNLINCGTLTAS